MSITTYADGRGIVGRRVNQVRDLIQKTFNGYFEMSVE